MLAKRAMTARHTWGLGRATILATLLNAIAILVGVFAVTWEAVHRLSDPVAVPGMTVMLVALISIAVNTGSALLFMSSRKGDLNARGAFLHTAADAAVSGAVVLAAAGIMLTGWDWLDPAVAIAVSLLIALTAAGLFREALHLSLDGVPFAIDRDAIADWLNSQDGVQSHHDLHIWPLSTTRAALAVHLVWDGTDADASSTALPMRWPTITALRMLPCNWNVSLARGRGRDHRLRYCKGQNSLGAGVCEPLYGHGLRAGREPKAQR